MLGRVWYEPRESSGSRFLFSFPLVEAKFQKKIQDSPKPVKRNCRETSPRTQAAQIESMSPILVVEDNAYAAASQKILELHARINCRVLVKMLRQLGFKQDDIYTAEDGIQALDRCG